jgi:hypothetical protein
MLKGTITVDRISRDTPFEEFDRRYYLPQRPVIVEGVTQGWAATTRWTPDYLKSIVGDSNGIKESLYWFDVGDEVFRADYQVPSFQQRLHEAHQTLRRENSARLWIAARGTRTRWHYDGNGVNGFNVQVKGGKRFFLVSPETPLPCASFSFFCRAGYDEPERVLGANYNFAAVELHEGDMLFLPQQWAHYVESLDDFNANINWVWSDVTSYPVDAAGCLRERECVACLGWVTRVLDRLGFEKLWLVNYIRNYGGLRDFELARQFAKSTPLPKLLARLTTELLGLVHGPWTSQKLRAAEMTLNGGVRRNALDFFQKSPKAG